jgi:hypothetical protein
MEETTVLKTVVASIALLGLVASAPARTPDAKQKKVRPMTFEGTIVEVDVAGSLLIIQSSANAAPAYLPFRIDPKTRITVEGRPSVLAQLEKGQHVDITYEPTADGNFATRVRGDKKASD